MLRIATGGQRTLTGVEESGFRSHVDGCATCRALLAEGDEDDWRWLSRVPADSAVGDDLLSLPMVDPIVFRAAEELGAGGMGRVTRAIDRRLGREIAIKEVLEPELHARFEREVAITAKLQHPSIVPVYEAGVFPGGSAFYTMRLVPGRSLADAITEATTLEARLRLLPHVRAAADALAYAHSLGVIHRDFKPANVLVGNFGETVVIDWGLAKTADDVAESWPERVSSPSLTRVGSVMGTPCFMSPSQASGSAGDESDDVYALGAVLYNVLAGAPPYWNSTAPDPDALIAATVKGPPQPIAELAPDAPEDLHAIVEHAMARARAERFASVAQLIEELARFEAGQLLRSRTYNARDLVIRWLRRHRLGVTLAVLGAIAAVVVGVLWLRVDRQADELAARRRGEQMTNLYQEVARQAYVIDRDLLRLETALEGLSTAAAWALESPEPIATDPIYFDDDFASSRKPDDFTDQTAYRWPVSVEYPVVSVAPGVDRETVRPKIRRLASLREHFRTLVLEAVRDPAGRSTNDLLRSRASSIDYAYVDLAEGVHVVWPGTASLRADYDVRDASFYNDSKNQHGRRWGAPYVDSTTDTAGDDLVLPCTKGVWSRSGAFLGVAGVELTVTKLLDTTMKLATRDTLRVSLVDQHGRRVVDSSLAGRRFETTGRDEAIQFVPFELPEVATAIQRRREGIIETTRDGRSIAAVYVRLDAIAWYYVVEVESSKLGIQ